ncbi:hypothetical protein TrVFT333_002523 [Trichoderma virens FT-333]|nr:hypothetical protein TrVFT333_002523 [Trichoderma virens FT-333]
MAIGKTHPSEERVSEPQITHLSELEVSQPVVLEPYHVDLLPEYGYVSREYLISGVAAGESYCTRILLRCPADSTHFSGLVVEEPSHLWGGTSIWRHINRWLMRKGHAWLEVDSQSPSAIGKIKNLDPERYKNMHFIPGPLADEFMDTIPFMTNVTREMLEQSYVDFKEKWWPATTQSPEIIAAASCALRSGKLGIKATRVILTGLSQTGGVTRRFITHSSHLRLPDGSLPFEAFIPCQSGGTALPDVPGAKIIELLGESEFQSVRLPCGVSGQILGVSHRRADSDSFRLYEIAGMAHRESRYPSDIDIKRCDEIARDEHGNAVGGVRTLHTDVPLSRIVAATPKGRPNWYCGSEWAFTPKILRHLYGTVANYRRLAGLAIGEQIQAGFLLPEDAEVLRRETVEGVTF